MGSKSFSLDGLDINKLTKSLAISLAGMLIAFLTTWLAGLDSSTITGAVISSGGALGVNFIRKFLKNNSGK
jgi:hypothetical protein